MSPSDEKPTDIHPGILASIITYFFMNRCNVHIEITHAHQRYVTQLVQLVSTGTHVYVLYVLCVLYVEVMDCTRTAVTRSGINMAWLSEYLDVNFITRKVYTKYVYSTHT